MKVLKEMPRRDPLNGTFELTVRCNLKCKMCLFRHDDSENAEIIKNERTAEEWINMATQVAESGTLNLLLTGGEPMLRPDFCEIYEGIYKQGFIITLYTNATLVTPKIMETLRKYPPHIIGVTIYGASEETYERVCGNGKAFGRTIDGIKKLSELPSNIEIRTTLIKDNVDDIDDIEILSNKLLGKNVNVSHSSYVLKSVRGGKSKAEECRLTPRENLQMTLKRSDKKVKRYFEEKGLEVPKYKYLHDLDNNDSSNNITLLGCDAGMNSYTISWDGKLLGCQILGEFYTDAMKDGFISAWNKYPYIVKIPKKNKECINCEYIDYCSRCCAIDYAENDLNDKPPEYFCGIAKELKSFIEDGGNTNEKI